MKKANYIGLIAAVLMALSTLFPWLGASASSSFAGFEGSYSESEIGVHFWGGIVGLIISIAGIFLMVKKFKFTILPGIINLIISLGYIFGWFWGREYQQMNASFDLEGFGSVSSSVSPLAGLILFALSSLSFIFFSIRYLKNPLPAMNGINDQLNNLTNQADQQISQIIQAAGQKENQICSNCKVQYPKNNKFCPNCGTQAVLDKFCTDCGSKISENIMFCTNCGMSPES